MPDLAQVNRVLEQLRQRASHERDAANRFSCCMLADFRSDAVVRKLVDELGDGPQFGVALVQRADDCCLVLLDQQTPVLQPIPEWNRSTHPHPLSLRCCNLVADALAGDLALELREGQLDPAEMGGPKC